MSALSIDLILINPDGEVLLGWRNNRPAQNCWFVPGGVVRKGEDLQRAFQRVVLDELGVLVNLKREEVFIGVYEHFYPDNFAGIKGTGTHDVVLAHRLLSEQHLSGLPSLEVLPKAQHEEYKWLSISELVTSPDVHSNTKAYFSA